MLQLILKIVTFFYFFNQNYGILPWLILAQKPKMLQNRPCLEKAILAILAGPEICCVLSNRAETSQVVFLRHNNPSPCTRGSLHKIECDDRQRLKCIFHYSHVPMCHFWLKSRFSREQSSVLQSLWKCTSSLFEVK